MPTKSGDMTKDGVVLKIRHQFARSDKGTNWHSATHAFRQGDDVGLYAVMLVCKHFSGAAKPTLYFVKNEKGSGFVALFAQSTQILLRGWNVARFALNGLHNYCRSFSCNVLQIFIRIEVDAARTRQKRTIGPFEIFITNN